MSLSFDFPSFQRTWGASVVPEQCPEQCEHPQQLLDDLADLLGSGDECDDAAADDPTPPATAAARCTADDAAAAPKAASSTSSSTSPRAVEQLPPAVLLLLTDHLALRDVAAMAGVCTCWHEAIMADSSVWRLQHARLLGNGWPWPPFVGAAPLELPGSLGCSSRLRLKTTLATTRVGLQYFVMRKGFEVLLEGFEALWAGLAAAAGGGGAQQLAPEPPSAQLQSPQPRERAQKAYHLPASADSSGACHQVLMLQTSSPAAAGGVAAPHHGSSSDQPAAGHPAAAPEDEQQQASGGRQLQRLVDKLARHDWKLTYSAYGVALGARCDEIAAQLAAWLDSSSSLSPGAAAAAHQAAPHAAASAVLAGHCAGGILWDVEAVAGGLTAGEVLAEPELLLAATHRGARPASAIQLWQQLLGGCWTPYRRWLELVAARCGLLGARVAAARQLAEPSSRGPPNAAVLPHLRNKGLLHFRSRVLLCHALRRPLQQAALFLAAAAAAGGTSCSEADLELLVAVRKALTELDVADGQDEGAEQQTHAKFRRCFGALLTRERRNRCLPASAW